MGADRGARAALGRRAAGGRAADPTGAERGGFIVRDRLCDPVIRPGGSPDPDERAWRGVFGCEDV